MLARGKDVLILDNCSTHYNLSFLAALQDAGVQCIFLPPYAPWFNPIEECFGAIKAWIRRNAKRVLADNKLEQAIVYHAFREVATAVKCSAWIRHAGYDTSSDHNMRDA